MIAAWMLSASLFALFAGLAALSGEQVLRTLRRPTRGIWAAAIAASVLWPLLVALRPADAPRAGVMLPPIRMTQLVSPALTNTRPHWMPATDRLLLLLWLAASVVMLVRLLRGSISARRVRRAAAREMIGGIPLLVSDEAGPAVIGLLRPDILYPRALIGLDAALRDVIVRHEDEHRRAGDVWLAFGGAVAVALMPWNVALWWMMRRARLALEIDCDARVLLMHADPVQYGKLLLLVAQTDMPMQLLPALASPRTHLERRIRTMLSTTPAHRRLRIAAGTLGLVLASVAALSAQVTSAPAAAVPRVATDTGTGPKKISGDTYFEFQIEKQARMVPGTFYLKYPAELLSAPVAGSVLVQFVVDDTGAMVPSTFKVLKTSGALFTAAVRDALVTTRWTPATVGGRAVKQLVQQPFEFPVPPAK